MPRLQRGETTEQPALSLNCPPVQVPPLHCPLLQPPLLPMLVPRLLHCVSAVQRQKSCFASHTGAGDRVVTHV